MPDNSAWGTDPDQPIDFSDYASADEQADELHAETSTPEATFTHLPVSREILTQADVAEGGDWDDDWLGDEVYDETTGEMLEPPRRKKTAAILQQRGRNPRLARAWERRRKVVELKVAGHTYEEIARVLGFNSIDGVRQAFNRAMADTRDVAEEWRDVLLARNEKMIQVLMPMADTGDIEAIDKIVKIQAQIAKITRMETIGAIGHGAGERGETVKDVVERIGMVEDVNAFLAALPGLVSLSPQPGAKIIDDEGNEIHDVTGGLA